jgi:hypothetical protein
MRDSGARVDVDVKRLEGRDLKEQRLWCRRAVKDWGSMVVGCCGCVWRGGLVAQLKREREVEK